MKNLFKWKLLYGGRMVCRNGVEGKILNVFIFKLNCFLYKRNLVKIGGVEELDFICICVYDFVYLFVIVY